MITHHHIGDAAYSYDEYRELLHELIAEGKTTGLNQSADYIEYTRVNIQRMKRLDKTIVLGEGLKGCLDSLREPLFWFVLTEGWCGDAAQNVPLLHHAEKYCSKIKLRLLLRDEHPEVMNNYLTRGSRSIPKLICMNEDFEEKFTWGPRPAELQKLVIEMLAKGVSKEEKGLMTQGWYNKDATKSLQHEICELLGELS